MEPKCCFCVDLKQGYLAYGIISLASRLAIIGCLYWVPQMIQPGDLNAETRYIYPTIGLSYFLYLTIKGIMEKRSILLFPFITISFLEIVSVIVWNMILTVIVGPIYLLNMTFLILFDGYPLFCLLMLYKQMKSEEAERRRDGLEDPLLTTI